MCIFCMIANKEINSKIVYEDEDFLAFLDLSQATKGHTLIVPKKHFDNILECSDDVLSKMMPVIKKVATILKDKLNAKGINVLSNCGEAAGQTVMHFHVHLIPRYDGDDLKIEFKDHSKDYELDIVLNEIK